MPEIRWILLALGALLIAGIWGWGARKSRGRGEALRADTGGGTGGNVVSPLTSAPLASTAVHSMPASPTRETRLAPLEPLKISTTDSQPLDSDFDIPVMANDDFEPPPRSNIMTDPAPTTDEERELPVLTQQVKSTPPLPAENAAALPERDSGSGSPAKGVPTVPASPAIPAAPAAEPKSTAIRTDTSGRFARAQRPPPKTAERQKIVGLRICAPAESHWPGQQLADQFAALRLEHGRYGIFHRISGEGRTVFCVASLVEPGTFDTARMAKTFFSGVTLFAVLPGPIDGTETFNEMLAAGRHLIESLGGMMQDGGANPLSPQGVGTMREEILQFERQLGAQSHG